MRRIAKSLLLATLLTIAFCEDSENQVDAGLKATQECPRDDPFGYKVLLPHESDCTKFYMCSNGMKIERKCAFLNDKGDRLYFNPKLEVCDYPWRVECKSEETTPNIPPSIGTTETGTSLVPLVENTTFPQSCPLGSYEEPLFFEHECNYRRYYKCTNQSQTLEECPQNYRFVLRLNMCISDAEFNNENAVCEKGRHIPDYRSCTMYYLCDVDKKMVHMTCSDGLLYNIARQTCDHPGNVACDPNVDPDRTCPSIDPPTTTEVVFVSPEVPPKECPNNTNEVVYLPHEFSCSHYYICSDGKKMLEGCECGLSFNEKTWECDTVQNAQCTSEKCRGDIFIRYPYPFTCNQYYECEVEKLSLKTCRRGTVFNPKSLRCDLPQNVDCSKRRRRSMVQ